jgi:hypothetical protein
MLVLELVSAAVPASVLLAEARVLVATLVLELV